MQYIITFFETILYHLFLTCMDIECYKNLLLGCLKCCFTLPVWATAIKDPSEFCVQLIFKKLFYCCKSGFYRFYFLNPFF